MNIPESLYWRIAIAFAALVTVVMGVFLIVLITSVLGRDDAVGRAVVAAAAATLLTCSGGAAIVFALGRPTSQTVRTVTEGARRVASGDLAHRVVSPSSDDAAELAEVFNTMAHSLQQTVQGIQTAQRLHAIAMDNMADGVVIVDSQKRTRFINRAAQWLLGTHAPNSIDRPLAQVIRDPDLLRLVDESVTDRQIRRSEIELLHHHRFLNVIAIPIASELGDGVLLTLQDVTGLRQVQTTRREFVTNVSHELRSPLASVQAMAETLQTGAIEDPATRDDFLHRINGDIHRMTALVEELLELSRLESGQVPVHLAPTSIPEVVDDVIERFRRPALDGKVRLFVDVPTDLPQVMAEVGKLDQILTNLVENALRFTPEGGTITVSAVAGSRHVEVSVADTGVGIPREHLPHVFERFYKVDRARREGGTGLGLAIVKHLVQVHGGEINADSIEGEGSTFTLSLTRATSIAQVGINSDSC